MHAPACVARGFGHRLGQGHDVVPRFCLDFADPLLGDHVRHRDLLDHGIVLSRDTAHLLVSPNQRTLDFELALVAAVFRPNLLEVLAAVAVIQRTEGHDVRRCGRPINLRRPMFRRNVRPPRRNAPRAWPYGPSGGRKRRRQGIHRPRMERRCSTGWPSRAGRRRR